MDDWIVVDASVIVKAFVAEDGSKAADLIWSSDAVLAAPSHALAEVGETLRRKHTSGEITDTQLMEACVVLPGSLLTVDIGEILAAAMRITKQVSAGFYDCLYLAAADRLDCMFVTADNRLVGAV